MSAEEIEILRELSQYNSLAMKRFSERALEGAVLRLVERGMIKKTENPSAAAKSKVLVMLSITESGLEAIGKA